MQSLFRTPRSAAIALTAVAFLAVLSIVAASLLGLFRPSVTGAAPAEPTTTEPASDQPIVAEGTLFTEAEPEAEPEPADHNHGGHDHDSGSIAEGDIEVENPSASDKPKLEVSGSVFFVPLEDGVQSSEARHAVNGNLVFLRIAGGRTLLLSGEGLGEVSTGAFSGSIAVTEEGIDALDAGDAVAIVDYIATPLAFDTGLSERVLESITAAEVPVELGTGVISRPEISEALGSKTHTVYVVVVDPPNYTCPTAVSNTSNGCGISDADIATMITEIDSYFEAETDGKVSFTQADANGAGNSGQVYRTVYNSTSYNCGTASGVNQMWTSAADTVASFNGWGSPPYAAYGVDDTFWFGGWDIEGEADDLSRHLLILTPPAYECGSGSQFVGLGSRWEDENVHRGGLAFSRWGAADENGYSVTAHELGHNLTFAHANLLYCAASHNDIDVDARSEGDVASSCVVDPYGDDSDLMGWAYANGTRDINSDKGLNGVSAPAKIRTGIYDGGTDFLSLTSAGGSQTVTLEPITATSGLRGIRVTDPDNGDRYFIEYRSGVGADSAATYLLAGSGGYESYWYDSPYTIDFRSGIRILKQGADGSSILLAAMKDPADNRARNTSLRAGDGFLARSGDLRISVISLGATAQVRVSFIVPLTNSKAPSISGLTSGAAQVGTTLTANAGTWQGDSVTYAYAWERSGVTIGTSSTLSVTPAHYGADLRLKVTATDAEGQTLTKTTSAVKVAQAPTTTALTLTGPGSALYGNGDDHQVAIDVDPVGAWTLPASGLTVDLKSGTATIATGIALDSSGQATTTLPASLAVGTHGITAVLTTPPAYPHIKGSTSPTRTAVVQIASTEATVSLSSASVDYGTPIELTLDVSIDNGGGSTVAATGKYEIRNGTTVIASGTLATGDNGTRTVTLPTLARGTHYLTVAFLGSANLKASTTETRKITVF